MLAQIFAEHNNQKEDQKLLFDTTCLDNHK